MPTPDDPVLIAQANWQGAGWDVGPHFIAALSLSRAAELLQSANQATLEQWGLTPARHEALAVLYFAQREEVPLRRLGKALMLHPASVTSTVDSLERLGYAERVPHPTDRRAVNVRITARGRQALEATARDLHADDFGMGVLTATEASQLFQLLTKIRLDSPPQTSDNGPTGRDQRPGWSSAAAGRSNRS